jgi:hypothetical protein
LPLLGTQLDQRRLGLEAFVAHRTFRVGWRGGRPQSSRNWKGGKVQWQSINSYGVTPWAHCSECVAVVVHEMLWLVCQDEYLLGVESTQFEPGSGTGGPCLWIISAVCRPCSSVSYHIPSYSPLSAVDLQYRYRWKTLSPWSRSSVSCPVFIFIPA